MNMLNFIFVGILLIILVFYTLNALIQKNWNDFFYGVCLLFVLTMNLPVITNVLVVLLLIIVHRYIALKELEHKNKEE